MTKQVVITMSDARFKEFPRQVSEMLDLATFIEADVQIKEV